MIRNCAVVLTLVTAFVLVGSDSTHANDIWRAGPLMGDYQGDWAKDVKVWPRGLVAQVVPRAEGKYVVHLLPEFDHRCPPVAVIDGKLDGVAIVFDDGTFSGRIENGRMSGKGPVKGKSGNFALKKVARSSPRLGVAPPEGAIVLFNGSGFEHWDGIGRKGEVVDVPWKLVDGVMEVAPTLKEHAFATSIGTKRTFQDYHLHLEFRLPLFLNASRQGRGNSGIIFEDYTFHELQVLDSYGEPGYYDECGSIYKIAAPHMNMCLPPLQWQSYDIVYRGPRYAPDGKLLQAARITVNQNGKIVQTDLELPDSDHAKRQRRENPNARKVGRIKLQNHGDAVQYRNIWLKELTPDDAVDIR